MPRDLDMDFEFQDEAVAPQRPVRRQPQNMGPSGPQGSRAPRGGSRRKKNNMTSIIILAVEVVVLIALIVLFFVLKSKIQGADSGSATATEESASGSSGGVNVDSDSFTLTCTKVQLATDVDGNPAAMIYFTFVNKTDTPLSMNEVFPPSLKQNGAECAQDPQLTEYPAEYSNKDMQVSGGQSVDCCYAFSISDLTSPLTLSIYDNYSTFTDIGSTEIPIS